MVVQFQAYSTFRKYYRERLSFGAVFYSFPSKHHFKKLMTSFRQVHMGPLFVKDIYEYPLINCIHQTLLTVLRNIYKTICTDMYIQVLKRPYLSLEQRGPEKAARFKDFLFSYSYLLKLSKIGITHA